LSSIDEKLDLLISVLRELLEKLEKLEERLERQNIDHPEIKIALEVASAFSLPLIRSLEIARMAYDVLIRLDKPDPITRAIIEVLSSCNEMSISEVYRGVRNIRGKASRRIIGERVRILLSKGIVVNMGSSERPRIILRKCLEKPHG
jgi:hypothetical protein